MSSLFQQYCCHLDISLSYSSAYHHSANPAEWAIRTVKSLMKKCSKAKQSWRLALLEYLATPLDSKTLSLSELNGRKFSSMLPNVSNFSSQHSDKLVERCDAQLQHNSQGRTLKESPVGSTVGYRDHANNQFHVGVISERQGRSYAISRESCCIISQNCIDLRQINVYVTCSGRMSKPTARLIASM